MNSNPPPKNAEMIINSLIDICVEGWRFGRLFIRILAKLDAEDAARHINQFRYYQKRIDESLESVGMRLVNIEGQPYEPGTAATALNISDFEPNDRLFVDQMIEPIIMSSDGVIKTGTVMLRKAE